MDRSILTEIGELLKAALILAERSDNGMLIYLITMTILQVHDQLDSQGSNSKN